MTVEPLPSDSGGLAPCLDEAGVSRSDLILVAGPGSLPAMLWLCRHGYERAVHLNASSSRRASPAADVLFIPHLAAASGLASILPPAGCLREGAVLVLRTPAGATGMSAELASAGWSLEHRLTEKGHAILVARRLAEADRKAA